MTVLLNIAFQKPFFLKKKIVSILFRFSLIQNRTWIFGHGALLKAFNNKLKIRFPITIFNVFFYSFHENSFADLSYVGYSLKQRY